LVNRFSDLERTCTDNYKCSIDNYRNRRYTVILFAL